MKKNGDAGGEDEAREGYRHTGEEKKGGGDGWQKTLAVFCTLLRTDFRACSVS